MKNNNLIRAIYIGKNGKICYGQTGEIERKDIKNKYFNSIAFYPDGQEHKFYEIDRKDIYFPIY